VPDRKTFVIVGGGLAGAKAAQALRVGGFDGRVVLDAGEPYDKPPYFFSDQYDLGLEYVGLHDPSDELVIRGSLEEARFQAFWIGADGKVTAGMHVNDWDAIDSIRTLVETRAEHHDAVR
jgi:3-phenylpropionate/trans-cinnamate dioxygenase ferredoxin reductase subunit